MSDVPQTDLQNKFSQLDTSIKYSLAHIDRPLLLGLAILFLAEDITKMNYLTASQIVDSLEAAGVSIEIDQIVNAFSRAGSHIKRKIIEGERYYRIMTPGRLLIEPMLGFGPISVSRIEAGKPLTSRRKLEDIFSRLSGSIRVCDPYYGINSFTVLTYFPSSSRVQFISSRTGEKESSLIVPVRDLKQEHPNIEIRILPFPNSLHDRYVLSEDTLLLLGHGIKDIGNKESFIVSMSTSYAMDIISTMMANFDEQWGKAIPI